jgi:purine-nucleoside phosphorylase
LGTSIQLGDIFVAMGASTDSKVNRIRLMDHDYAAIADYHLLSTSVQIAKEQGKKVHVGNVFSADLFYTPQPELFDKLEKMNVLAVEMESAGIYGLAAEYGARALTLLTVSDQIRTHQHLSAEARQTSFGSMIDIALETAVRI